MQQHPWQGRSGRSYRPAEGSLVSESFQTSGGPAVEEEALSRLLARLEREIREYELRYELRSSRLVAALRSGALRETAEVANWLIAYHTLRALRREQQARAK